MSTIESLVGKTFTSVLGEVDGDELHFKSEGEHYRFYHIQDCCEGVSITDICGDLSDLVGQPILVAEEEISEGQQGFNSTTWTFYKFATIKGSVTVRWLGQSNGYYSESVDFEKVEEAQDE